MAANMFKDKVRFSVNKTSVHGYVQAPLVKIGGKEFGKKKQPPAQTDEKPDESCSQTKDFISRLVISLKTVFRVIIQDCPRQKKLNVQFFILSHNKKKKISLWFFFCKHLDVVVLVSK